METVNIVTGMLEDITLKEYCSLSETEQQDVITEYGVCIGERNFSEYKMVLFQVSSFYVEIKYHVLHKCIDGYYPFESTELLTPYLQDIDISAIL